MKHSLFTCICLTLVIFTANSAADEKPMSVSEVLKHTPEKLAQILGNTSEAGEDHAAQLWATAKKIETNSTLGKKSVQSVQRLNQWRTVLNTWADLTLHAKSIETGGGTLWGHLSARNDAWIEEFLAKHKDIVDCSHRQVS